MAGKKFDKGKPRWDLVPWSGLHSFVAVLTHGADKYGDHNWQELAGGRERYFAAALRHLLAWKEGELLDPDSGLKHLGHAICNLVFLAWFDDHGYPEAMPESHEGEVPGYLGPDNYDERDGKK